MKNLINKIENFFSEDPNRVIKISGLSREDASSLKKDINKTNCGYQIKEEIEIKIGANFLLDSSKGIYSIIITKQSHSS